MPLLEFTDIGIYCPQADVFIDPWKPVEKAIISHGHADHLYPGHRHYLCTTDALPVVRHRLSPKMPMIQALGYGETIAINGVHISFHPAGHIPGSAQVKLSFNGEVWVFSGDYKLQDDGISTPFAPQRCHVFITESTFGLPVYKWKSQQEVFGEINDWWRQNRDEGRTSVLTGYTLGKSQRILRHVDTSIGNIFTHGAVDVVNAVMRAQGIDLPVAPRVTNDTPKEALKGALIVSPPSAVGSPWVRRFLPYSLGVASGWMKLRGTRRRRGADRGFVLSDHADWNELNTAVLETGAEKVFVTHGYSEIFAHWLREQGIDAHEVKTRFEGELGEMAEGEQPTTNSQQPTANRQMQHFTTLFSQLDQTTKTLNKIKALIAYFEAAPDQDKLWAVALLSHRRPKRTVTTSYLAQWASELSGLPQWLFDESYHVVGDLAETITLMLPVEYEPSHYSLSFWMDFIKDLEPKEVPEKKEQIIWAWRQLNESERLVFNKLITGGFRIGVSQQLMVKALAKYAGVKESTVAHRLMGHWSPETNTFGDLLFADDETDLSKPYPFYLAYALDMPVDTLGDPDEWLAERKWDGIRGQVIVRMGQLFVWSRGEELVTDRYPEYQAMLDVLPDGTVLDGEILPFKDGRPMSFNHLQKRIGRKTLSRKLLTDVPVAFVAYDVLEWHAADIRQQPLSERRKIVEALCPTDHPVLRLSPEVIFHTWEDLARAREESRAFVSEGIMLKRRSSIYRNGRRRGDWWKWKIDPFSVDAVMIYAMRGHGRRANLYTDYTFAVWNGPELVPFAKAYSGLTDDEIREVDRWVKQNTIERFGPVRSVKPKLVFELAFEGIQRSTRHKSGIALRFPRIARWRKDKSPSEANTLSDLNALLNVVEF